MPAPMTGTLAVSNKTFAVGIASPVVSEERGGGEDTQCLLGTVHDMSHNTVRSRALYWSGNPGGRVRAVTNSGSFARWHSFLPFRADTAGSGGRPRTHLARAALAIYLQV